MAAWRASGLRPRDGDYFYALGDIRYHMPEKHGYIAFVKLASTVEEGYIGDRT